MNEVKEIEIDSAFRNRTTFPVQTYFEIPVNSFNDPSNIFSAIDPVSDALPRFSFQSFTLDPTISGSSAIAGTVTARYGDRIIASFPKLFTILNYYRFLSTSTGLNISHYSYLGNDSFGNDVGKFTIPNNAFAVGNPIQIIWTSSQNFSTTGQKNWFVPAYDGQYFKYLYNETKNSEARILATDGTTSTIDIFVTDLTWSTTDSFSLRNSLPHAVTTSVAPNTTFTVAIVPGVQFYENSFLFVENLYTGKLKSLTPGGIATVSPAIETPIPVGSVVQILPFRENFQSLIYIGSQLAQIENKTYLVELVTLTLPNCLTQRGPRVSSYPYLYVEFLDTNCTPHQNIMSNNPHSNKIFFRVTPSRIQQTRDWLNFDCDGSSKTLRFKPTATNFRFSVRTPDGNLLLLPLDNQTPTPPNPNLQVSVLLNVRIRNN